MRRQEVVLRERFHGTCVSWPWALPCVCVCVLYCRWCSHTFRIYACQSKRAMCMRVCTGAASTNTRKQKKNSRESETYQIRIRIALRFGCDTHSFGSVHYSGTGLFLAFTLCVIPATECATLLCICIWGPTAAVRPTIHTHWRSETNRSE